MRRILNLVLPTVFIALAVALVMLFDTALIPQAPEPTQQTPVPTTTISPDSLGPSEGTDEQAPSGVRLQEPDAPDLVRAAELFGS